MANDKMGYVTWTEINAALEARKAEILKEVDDRIAAAVDPIAESIEECIQLGDPVSLKLSSGQFMSPMDGGPKTAEQPIAFITKAENYAYESFTLVKGEG